MAMKPKAAKLMIAIMGKPAGKPTVAPKTAPKTTVKRKTTSKKTIKGKTKNALPWSSQNKGMKGC